MLDITSMLKLDEKATLKSMEKAIYKYRKLLFLMPLVSMPSVTASYSFVPPSTAERMTTIERAVHKNREREKLLIERDNYMHVFHQAIDRLKPDDKYIIVNKYLQKEKALDYEIYSDLGIGRTKYYTLKKDALITLAIYLGIEVYKSDL